MKNKKKLQDICTIITDGSHYSPPTVENGRPIASVKDMLDYEIDLDNCRQISEEEYQALEKGNCKPQINDVLIAKDGSYLKKVFVVEEEPDYVVLSSIGIFRPNTEIVNPYYLAYCFNQDSFKKYVSNGFVSGTALKRIVLDAFKRIKISIPPMEVQNEIVTNIKPIDDKIKKNLELIVKFEKYMEILFHKWFVNFNFPDENGKPYKCNNGQIQKVNGKLLPLGWSFKKVEEVAETIIDHRGKTPAKLGSDWSKEGITALSAKTIKGGKLVNLDKANKVSNELYEKWMPEKLAEGDILMTSEAPLGEFYFMLIDTEYCLSQRLFAIRPKASEVLPLYLYFELSQPRGYKKIIARQSGSTVFGIRQEELRKVEILAPDLKVQEKFNELVFPMMKKIRICEKENISLMKIRDLLIKKLIS